MPCQQNPGIRRSRGERPWRLRVAHHGHVYLRPAAHARRVKTAEVLGDHHAGKMGLGREIPRGEVRAVESGHEAPFAVQEVRLIFAAVANELGSVALPEHENAASREAAGGGHFERSRLGVDSACERGHAVVAQIVA